jgi:AAA domain
MTAPPEKKRARPLAKDERCNSSDQRAFCKIDAHELHRRIANRPDEFLKELFGDKFDKAQNGSFRVGSKGSLAISIKDGVLFWYSHEEGIGGDAIDLWQRERGGTAGEALRAAAAWAGVAPTPNGETHQARTDKKPRVNGAKLNGKEVTVTAPTDWSAQWAECLTRATDERLTPIATERGISLEFLRYAAANGWLGFYGNNVAFPVVNGDGVTVACHYRRPDRSWRYEPTEQGTHPLIIGDPVKAGIAWTFESQWDAFSVLDALAVHEDPDSFTKYFAVIVTRSAGNGALATKAAAGCKALVVWLQNDEPNPKTGKVPSEDWMQAIVATAPAGMAVRRAGTPQEHADAGDWCKAARPSREDILAVVADAFQTEAPKSQNDTLPDSATEAPPTEAPPTEAPPTEAPPPLTPLMDISAGEPDPRKTVLGDRFLCIGGGMLFVGPSGIGKSSASVQQDILWSLGRPAFGIRPARPLRILTIQAENDAEDLAEMRDGVCRGLGLTAADRQLVRERVFYETEQARTGAEFLAYADKRLAQGQFDLLRIDPFLAYLGGDVNNAEQTAAFLRNGLNPILTRHAVACILNHHTPKVTNRDTSNWRGSDWMYSGAGSADITNWTRAALVIDPTHAPGVFKFIAAKRGNRIGWVNEDGERETLRHFCHASDGLYWREATDGDIEAVEAAAQAKKQGKSVKTAADLKAHVPTVGAIPKVELLTKAMGSGFAKHEAAATLKKLLETGAVFRWEIKRKGTNPEVRISRHEQTLTEATA